MALTEGCGFTGFFFTSFVLIMFVLLSCHNGCCDSYYIELLVFEGLVVRGGALVRVEVPSGRTQVV